MESWDLAGKMLRQGAYDDAALRRTAEDGCRHMIPATPSMKSGQGWD